MLKYWNELLEDGFKRGIEYEIMLVPNIVNITYGRGVGYTFEEEVFDKSITEISATKIRKKLREEGKLWNFFPLSSQKRVFEAVRIEM